MSVFDYNDYRLFLKESIESRKKLFPAFSFRYVSHHLGCNPGFFNRIVNGGRNLSIDMAIKICRLLKLKKREQQYFLLLVQYNQSKKELEKEHLFSQLKAFKGSKVYQVTQNQYPLYQNWFNMALRELLNIVPCYDISDKTCQKLAGLIQPAIPSSEIKKSLKMLLALGIIKKTHTGRLILDEKLISTGSDIPTSVVRLYLKEFFKLGEESLDRFAKNERVCASVTMSCSAENYQKIQNVLSRCRKEILDIVSEDPNHIDRVYHLNMQLFPVSNPYNGN